MDAFFLDRINAAQLDDDDFSFTFNSWVSNTIDSLNEIISDIEAQLNGADVATFTTQLTTAEINVLIGMDSTPVLPAGSLWFDTSINKLRVLVTAAVPGISDGITEVVTSA